MTKGWYGNRMAHGLASRGIKSKMKVGFTNIGGLLGEKPNSVDDILEIRNRMVEAKERDDAHAMYQEILRILPNMDEDEGSNIEYVYNEHSMFYHPKDDEEFEALFTQLLYFHKIGDTHGMYITALQMLPDKIKEDGDKEYTSFFFGQAKGIKKPTNLVWSNVETLRKEYEGQSTGNLVKMAENLDGVIRRNRTHPKGLNAEQKEEYIDDVNKFQAMTLELDRRGVQI